MVALSADAETVVKLECPKCGSEVPIPAEATQSPGSRVVCPGCGSGFRLRPRRPSQPTAAPPQVGTEIPLPASTGAEAPTVAGGGPPPRPRASETVFQNGETLAGRYRIERFLAHGGMGEVYEAWDEALQERVALKTIQAHADGEAGTVERFKREIQLARKISHPNICRIHDLGQHPAENGGPPIIFLTMELLEGETLSERLALRGRLAVGESRPILAQMAAALDAAHTAGIVHRDFKSENVFLCQNDGELRVVVTDFGIARGAGHDDPFAAMVTGAGVVGTPAYMAPEQVEGGEITTATDLYALGVVLYEMLTGRVPFVGENPLTTAVKRLKEAPSPPRVYVPDIDPRWERAILRCLERQPAERFESAGEVLDAVSGAPTTRTAPRSTRPVSERPRATAPVPPPTPPGRKRRRALEIALLAVILLAAATYFLPRGGDGARAPRQSVAVLDFHNTTGRTEMAWLSTALSEMLGTEIARGESLSTVPGENVARVSQELELDASDGLSGDTLQRLRALLGCDYVVLGSYVAVGEGENHRIRLDLRLQDATLGETVHSLAHDGAEAQLFELVGTVGQELRELLGAEVAAESGEAGLPTDPRSAQLYAEALQRLRGNDPAAARGLLEEAIERDPGKALLHSALSNAWSALGYRERAAAEAQRAFELSSELGREDRLVIEARFRETTGEWEAAASAWETLFRLFPDNLDYGLRLAAAQTAALQPRAALATIDELRSLPAPSSEDPRIDLAEAAAAGLVSDFERQLDAAERAAVRAEALGAGRRVAQARLTQAHTHRFLGQLEASLETAREAHRRYAELGDAAGTAQALTALGNAVFDRGELEAAAANYREALEVSRRLGDQGGVASGLNNLALVIKRGGELDRAQELYREAEAIYRETGDVRGTATTINNRASILYGRDRLGEARMLFEEAVAIWEGLGDGSSAANGLNNLAVALRFEGLLDESADLHGRALELRRSAGQRLGQAASLSNLAAVLIDRGELTAAAGHLAEARELIAGVERPGLESLVLHESGRMELERGELEAARRALEKALELRRESGDERSLLKTRLAFGRLLLEEGGAAAAEVEAQLIALDSRRDARPAEEARAFLLAARSHLAREEPAEAARALDQARELIALSERPALGLELRLLEARRRAVEGEAAAAIRELSELEAETERWGYGGLRFETLLELGRLELETGRLEAGQEHLMELQQAAELAGATGYAREATEALPELPTSELVP